MPQDFVKPLVVAIFYAIFALLSWRRLPWAVLFVVATLPSYLIRFRVGPMPMTLLEGMLLVVIVVWAMQKLRAWRNESGITNHESWVGLIRKSLIHNSLFMLPVALFLTAATIGMFVAPDLRAAAGAWKAYFIEPILFFVILLDLLIHHPNLLNRRQIIAALSVSALLLSLYAIYQRFTGFGIPPPWNAELRVTSLFPYPNALGLFLGPLVPLFVARLLSSFRHPERSEPQASGVEGSRADARQLFAMCYWLFATIATIVAIVFAKSTGAIVGVVAGLLIMAGLYFVRAFRAWRNESRIMNHESWAEALPPSHRRQGLPIFQFHYSLFIILFAIIIALAIAWFSFPQARDELLLRDWSGHVRRTQWTETIEMLKDRPIFGAGLAGYQETLAPYHKATYLEIFEYPHNILLNFWSETGLLGLIAFVWFIVVFFRNALYNAHNPSQPPLILRGGDRTYPPLKSDASVGLRPRRASEIRGGRGSYESITLGAATSMIVILVHGLVDVPYLKNDLAMLFWIIFALGLTPRLKRTSARSAVLT